MLLRWIPFEDAIDNLQRFYEAELVNAVLTNGGASIATIAIVERE